MRAKEFVINIPIHITMNSDGSVDVQQPTDEPEQTDEPGTFVPPLQQKIELMKATAGKESSVINQLIADEDEPFEG